MRQGTPLWSLDTYLLTPILCGTMPDQCHPRNYAPLPVGLVLPYLESCSTSHGQAARHMVEVLLGHRAGQERAS